MRQTCKAAGIAGNQEEIRVARTDVMYLELSRILLRRDVVKGASDQLSHLLDGIVCLAQARTVGLQCINKLRRVQSRQSLLQRCIREFTKHCKAGSLNSIATYV